MMFLVVFGVLLGCAGLTQGGFIPYYNVSVNNHQNLTNRWQVQINIDHDDDQPYDMFFAHSKNSTLAKLAGEFTCPKSNVIGTQMTGLEILSDTASTTEESKMAGSKKCPPGYELLAGVGYYKVYGKNDKRSWQDAEDLCELEGGHLVVIDSDQELRYVRMLAFQYHKEVNLFIGIHDRFKEGDFITVFNETMKSTRYAMWYRGEPNGGTKENCALFYYNPNTLENGLLDYSCAEVNGFICKIEIK